jgi:hypothetical protein
LSFSSEDSEKLLRGGMFDVFSKLFTRLTFVTSTLPFPHDALERGLLVVLQVVELYEACVDDFLENELLKTMMNMFVTGCSLAVCGPLSEPIRRIVLHICCILVECGNSVLSVKKLINIGYVSLLLNSFETFVKERKKRREELDSILEEISRTFQNWSVKGFNSPDTTSGENSLFSELEKMNTIERLSNLFEILKRLRTPSDDLKECLNYIVLTVCILYRGREPPLSCGKILSHCDEIKRSPSPSEGYDYPKWMGVTWRGMQNADRVLNEWKKRDGKKEL